MQHDVFNGLSCPSEHDENEIEENNNVMMVRPVEETAALFLLTLKEKYKLTQKALDFALGSVNEINAGVCDSLYGRLLMLVWN